MNALKDLQAATRYRKFSHEADLNQFLQERFPRATAEERIAMKLDLAARGKFRLAAAGELATDQTPAPGALAIDRREYRTPTPTSEVTRMLERAQLPPTRSYSLSEVEEKLNASDFDVIQKIACKHELASLGLLRR
jgi:hypothetical protein